jgi:hypothetical protein
MTRCSFWLRIGCVFAVGITVALSGCARLAPNHGESYEGDDATWGERFRHPEDEHEEFFFNQKSRQIEKSLGM